MTYALFLKPRKAEDRDPEVDKGVEITNAFYIRLASLYPDLQEGWRYRMSLIYTGIMLFMYIYGTAAYVIATYHAIKWKDVELIGETLCFGVHTYVCFIVYIVFTNNTHLTDALMKQAGQGTYQYDRPMTSEEHQIKTSYEREARNYGRRAFWLVFAVAIFQMAIIPICNGFRGRYTSVIPNETAPINKFTPLPVWTPYEAVDSTSFKILFGFQLAPGLVEFFIIHAGITFFIGCCCVTLKDHKLLLHSLGEMYDRALYMYENKGYVSYGRAKNFQIPEFQQCMRSCLRENVRHHIQIIRFFKQLQTIVGWTVLAIFTGAAVQVSAPPYALVKIAQMGSTEVIFTTGLVMTCHCFFTLSLLYKYCQYGQQVIDLSGEILTAYYNTPWQECGIPFRRMLIIAMTNSKKLLEPKANVIGVTASMATFLELVKQSYTVFNLLVTTED